MKILHRSRNKLDEWPPLHREKWIVGGISTRSISRPLIHSKLSRPWKAHNFPKLSREVVNNFRESGDRSKNSTFFLFAPKDPFGESFSKIIFKSSSEFLFWKKIWKFEIGQNVPNLHNFYWAFSAFSQRSYKTAKNYLRFIFS